MYTKLKVISCVCVHILFKGGSPMNSKQNLLTLFPESMRGLLAATFSDISHIQEIRFRIGQPTLVYKNSKELFLTKEGTLAFTPERSYAASESEIRQLIAHICNYSLYAYEDEIKQGYITLQGGHRVGVAGQIVMGEQRVHTMKNITFVNIRISHEIKGVADVVIPRMYRNGIFQNGMIISPPGCGKTTLLRDIVRQVSDGNAYGKGVSVGVVDERSEIAGCFMGIPQNDVGMRTDVLDACPKVHGMMMLIRAMAPKVIAIDEIGSVEDVRAMLTVVRCGCKFIATIHADTIEEVKEKAFLRELMKENIFRRFILLSCRKGIGSIENIYENGEII